MPGVVYTAALDTFEGFESEDIRALLVGVGYVFDEADEFVQDVTTWETVTSGYTRETLSGLVRSVSAGRITFDADDPDFGPIDAGDFIGGMVVYRHVTDDTDSPVLVYYPVPMSAAETTGSSYVLNFSAAGLLFIRNRAT